jgi:MFS family permease
MSQSEGQATAAPDGPAATRWAVVFVLFAAGIVAAGHIGMLPAALPAIRRDMAIDLVTAGWVLSIFSVTAVGLGMLAGGVADRLGHRRVIVGSVVLLALGAGCGASVASEPWLLAARALEGLGFVGVVVSAPSLIAQATRRDDRRLALGLWGAYMPGGLGLLLLIAPSLLHPLGWRGFWWIVAGATLLWALVVGLALRSFAPAAAPAQRDLRAWFGDLRQTLARPGLWWLAVCFSVYSLPWMALMAWLPSYLVEQRGLGVTLAAHLTVLVVAVNVPGNILGGWLLQRGVPRWRLLLATGALSLLCGLGIFSDATPDAWRYALCLLFSGFGGMLPAAALAGAPRFAPSPRHIGGANGMLVQGSAVGQLAGPPIIAMAVSAAGGWQGGAWIFAACGVLGLGFALAVRALERRL